MVSAMKWTPKMHAEMRYWEQLFDAYVAGFVKPDEFKDLCGVEKKDQHKKVELAKVSEESKAIKKRKSSLTAGNVSSSPSLDQGIGKLNEDQFRETPKTQVVEALRKSVSHPRRKHAKPQVVESTSPQQRAQLKKVSEESNVKKKDEVSVVDWVDTLPEEYLEILHQRREKVTPAPREKPSMSRVISRRHLTRCKSVVSVRRLAVL